jgi:hypothetical protein
MNLIDDFKTKLIGLYNNQKQAFNYPQQWANIFTEFVENSDGSIYAKSWYVYEGSQNPYKETIIVPIQSDKKIIVDTFNYKTKENLFQIEFEYINNMWFGENKKGEIKEKNMYISTTIKFDGINYFSRDAGYSSETGEFLWGKKENEGMFHFIKQ